MECVLGSPVLTERDGARTAAPIAAQPPCGVCAFCRVIKINNLGWCEAPQAVEHPRRTEKPPGTPSGRRLRLEIRKPPVERLFPPSGGVSRGSVRVGGETFLLPSYGFSFGYKRKGVSIAPPTEARRKNLCAARERPRLPLRREVDACIKDLSRQTEGERQ